MKIGYFLSSEEYDPRELVDQARRAAQAGFHALWISDHYHPWNDQQGHNQLSAPVGPDLEQHVAPLQAYADAGVDERFVQQIGPEQELFFREWAPAVLPRFS
jgi:hypothetical protein